MNRKWTWGSCIQANVAFTDNQWPHSCQRKYDPKSLMNAESMHFQYLKEILLNIYHNRGFLEDPRKVKNNQNSSNSSWVGILKDSLEIRMKLSICLLFYVNNLFHPTELVLFPLYFSTLCNISMCLFSRRNARPNSHKCMLGSLVEKCWWFVPNKEKKL